VRGKCRGGRRVFYAVAVRERVQFGAEGVAARGVGAVSAAARVGPRVAARAGARRLRQCERGPHCEQYQKKQEKRGSSAADARHLRKPTACFSD
jgi:hypothetical protein